MPALLGLIRTILQLAIPALIQEWFAERAKKRAESKGARLKKEEIDVKIDSAPIDDLVAESNKRYGPTTSNGSEGE